MTQRFCQANISNGNVGSYCSLLIEKNTKLRMQNHRFCRIIFHKLDSQYLFYELICCLVVETLTRQKIQKTVGFNYPSSMICTTVLTSAMYARNKANTLEHSTNILRCNVKMQLLIIKNQTLVSSQTGGLLMAHHFIDVEY